MSNKEIVEALKDSSKDGKKDIFEVSGVRIQVKPVSAMLIQHITSTIKDPKPPLVPNMDKDGKLEENPFDPAYVAGMQEAQTKRATATSDAMVMFGLDLLDGLPEDETWMTNLQHLEKRGLIDLSGFDFTDPFDKVFAFKKFVAGTNFIIMEVTRVSGVSQVDIDAATNSFRGNETQ